MTTKIEAVTIVTRQGVNTHRIGLTYNGLVLDRITDCTMEYPEAFVPIYQGYTKENELVFEAINAPVEIEYK